MMFLQLAYSADVIRSNTAEIAEVLTDSVLNPKYNPWEVAEQIFRLKEDLKKYQTNHMGVMQEVSISYQSLPYWTSEVVVILEAVRLSILICMPGVIP